MTLRQEVGLFGARTMSLGAIIVTGAFVSSITASYLSQFPRQAISRNTAG
jgi:hypothetical protein